MLERLEPDVREQATRMRNIFGRRPAMHEHARKQHVLECRKGRQQSRNTARLRTRLRDYNLTQAPFRRDDATHASTNATPFTPSSTVG